MMRSLRSASAPFKKDDLVQVKRDVAALPRRDGWGCIGLVVSVDEAACNVTVDFEVEELEPWRKVATGEVRFMRKEIKFSALEKVESEPLPLSSSTSRTSTKKKQQPQKTKAAAATEQPPAGKRARNGGKETAASARNGGKETAAAAAARAALAAKLRASASIESGSSDPSQDAVRVRFTLEPCLQTLRAWPPHASTLPQPGWGDTSRRSLGRAGVATGRPRRAPDDCTRCRHGSRRRCASSWRTCRSSAASRCRSRRLTTSAATASSSATT